MERGSIARVTARWRRGAVVACGLLAFAAAELAEAQGRARGELEGPRGPRAGERVGAVTAEPPAPPPPPGGPPGKTGNPPPGPYRLPGGAYPVRPLPGPDASRVHPPIMSGPTNAGLSAGGPQPGIAAAAIGPIAPTGAMGAMAPLSAAAATVPSTSPGGSRITEIIPPASGTAIGAQAAAARSAGMSPIGGVAPLAGADSCVNVFVRSANVDGREVVSVDLHGDGLIKGAVAPHLAGELLSRAGPPAGGARAACVPTALAQSLFDPVINLAAADPAVRMARVDGRWVLAGSAAPQPVVKWVPPTKLAAATTRGAPKAQAKKPAPRPAATRVSYAVYP